MTEEPLLEICSLDVGFAAYGLTAQVLHGVDLRVKAGQRVAVIGESGSGKTVTMKTVIGTLPHPAGRVLGGSIRFQGREMVGAPPRELLKVRGNRVSMIFQEPMTSLNPLHTIEKQIAEILLLHKGMTGKAARDRIVALLDQVGKIGRAHV